MVNERFEHVSQKDQPSRPSETTSPPDESEVRDIFAEASFSGDTANAKLDKSSQASWRLRAAMWLSQKLMVKNVTVRGSEHLAEIPKGEKVIFITSHMSDLDVTLAAYVLGSQFNVAIADQSVHHELSGEAVPYLAIKLMGEENFLRIDVKKEKGVQRGTFNPDNYRAMQTAMDRGKALIFAAHNPSLSGELEKAGVGAAYLASLTDAVIVPIGVELQTSKNLGLADNVGTTLKERVPAVLTIGAPFKFTATSELSEMGTLLHKRESDPKAFTTEDRQRFFTLSKILKARAEQIMKRLAPLVSPQKRGPYKETPPAATA